MKVVARATAARQAPELCCSHHHPGPSVQAKTIARVSIRTQRMQDTVEWKAAKLNLPFDLSPIQQLSFETAAENYHHFNRSLFF